MKLSEIEPRFHLRVERDAEFHNLGFLSDQLSRKLVFLESAQYLRALARADGICGVITTPALARRIPRALGVAATPLPRRTFFELHNYLARQTNFYGEDWPSEIDPAAQIHARAWIAEKNVRIGPGAIVEPNATILEGACIGSEVRLRAGSVIGGMGFQLSRFDQSVLDLVHAGSVSIRDRVDILPNAVVARGVFRQTTLIGEDSRIGNLAFVSHNVQVGRRCFIGHNAIVNGNVTIGDEAWIGPNATVANNLSIGDGAQISLGATVLRSVAAGERVTGFAAVKHQRLLRHIAALDHSNKRSAGRKK